MIAENLVLGTAREVRALRALGAGLGLASGGSAGSSSGGLRAPGVKEELPEGATPKKKPPGGDKEASEEYEYEESAEEEPPEKDQIARPVSPAPVDTRPTLPRRSRVPESEVSTRREEESRGHLESSHKKRSRSRRRREESKDKRREKDPERKKDRRDPGEREPDRRERPEEEKKKKRRKGKRGGKKHKRLHRLEADPYRAIHRSLDKNVLDNRERLDRHPLP